MNVLSVHTWCVRGELSRPAAGVRFCEVFAARVGPARRRSTAYRTFYPPDVTVLWGARFCWRAGYVYISWSLGSSTCVTLLNCEEEL